MPTSGRDRMYCFLFARTLRTHKSISRSTSLRKLSAWVGQVSATVILVSTSVAVICILALRSPPPLSLSAAGFTAQLTFFPMLLSAACHAGTVRNVQHLSTLTTAFAVSSAPLRPSQDLVQYQGGLLSRRRIHPLTDSVFTATASAWTTRRGPRKIKGQRCDYYIFPASFALPCVHCLHSPLLSPLTLTLYTSYSSCKAVDPVLECFITTATTGEYSLTLMWGYRDHGNHAVRSSHSNLKRVRLLIFNPSYTRLTLDLHHCQGSKPNSPSSPRTRWRVFITTSGYQTKTSLPPSLSTRTNG